MTTEAMESPVSLYLNAKIKQLDEELSSIPKGQERIRSTLERKRIRLAGALIAVDVFRPTVSSLLTRRLIEGHVKNDLHTLQESTIHQDSLDRAALLEQCGMGVLALRDLRSRKFGKLVAQFVQLQ